jgi:LPS sulfotransferase NodH
VTPPRRTGHVILFHTGRSGSTVLGDMLDQHSCMVWGGEVLERMLHRAAARRRVGIDRLHGHFDLDDFVRGVRARMRLLGGDLIYGLEIQGYHLEMMSADTATVLARLGALGFDRYLVLERSNPIRQVVSQLVALDRGKHHIAQGTHVGRVKLKIEPERLYIGHRIQSLDEVLRGYDSFLDSLTCQLAGRSLLYLNYERDIEDDPRRAYEMVCRFLGLQPQRPKIRLGKTTAYPLTELIGNFSAVRDYLVRHHRENLLSDEVEQ